MINILQFLERSPSNNYAKRRTNGPAGEIRAQEVRSEVPALHLERLSVHEVALHNFHDGIGEAHTEEGVLDLCVPVDLTEFEETTGDLGGILTGRLSKGGSRRHKNS